MIHELPRSTRNRGRSHSRRGTCTAALGSHSFDKSRKRRPRGATCETLWWLRRMDGGWVDDWYDDGESTRTAELSVSVIELSKVEWVCNSSTMNRAAAFKRDPISRCVVLSTLRKTTFCDVLAHLFIAWMLASRRHFIFFAQCPSSPRPSTSSSLNSFCTMYCCYSACHRQAVLLLLSGAAYIFTRKYFPLINPKHPVYSLFLQHLFQIACP